MIMGRGISLALVALALLAGPALAQEATPEMGPDADEAPPKREIKPPNRVRSNDKALRAFIKAIEDTSTVEKEDPFAALKALEAAAKKSKPAAAPEGEDALPEDVMPEDAFPKDTIPEDGPPDAVPMTPEEIAALRAQIQAQVQACWTLPDSVPNPRDLVVLVKARFNIDGSLDNAEIVDQTRAETDPTFGAIAASAVKAVETCTPLSVPRAQYETWKLTLLTFDPASLLRR